MRRIISILASVLAVIGLASCSGTGKALLPNVSGKAGEVIVVIERADWEGALGNEVRDLLAAGSTDVASTLTRNEKIMTKTLDRIIKAYEKNG